METDTLILVNGIVTNLSKHVYIYIMNQPDIQLSKVVRSSDTVREDGENVDLVWKPDGSQLVVLVSIYGFRLSAAILQFMLTLYLFFLMGAVAAFSFSIQTNEGFLHFYDIVELDTPLLEYHFRTAHHLANGPGENKSTTNRCLRFRMALEIDSGTQWYAITFLPLFKLLIQEMASNGSCG